MVTVPLKMVRLERMSDYRYIGFDKPTVPRAGKTTCAHRRTICSDVADSNTATVVHRDEMFPKHKHQHDG